MNYSIEPLGDRAVTIELTDTAPDGRMAAALFGQLDRRQLPWIVDLVPAYASLTVVFDPVKLDSFTRPHQITAAGSSFEAAAAELRRILPEAQQSVSSLAAARRIEIPVWYGGSYGPDLAAASERAGLTIDAFIELHSEAEYTVAMIGFMPGFPYLTGMPEQLQQPRKQTPRASVPAGSVGIAGLQTGIYPLSVPGGWQIIGRTTLELFQPQQQKVLLRAGDRVRFVKAAAPSESLRQQHGGRHPL